VLLADPRTDLAVLKIDTKGEHLPWCLLPTATRCRWATWCWRSAILSMSARPSPWASSGLARNQIPPATISSTRPTRHQSRQFRRRAGTTDGSWRASTPQSIAQRRSIGIGLRHSANLARRVWKASRAAQERRTRQRAAGLGGASASRSPARSRSMGLPRPGGVLIKDIYPGGPLRKRRQSGEVGSRWRRGGGRLQSLNYRTAPIAPRQREMHVAAGKAARDVS